MNLRDLEAADAWLAQFDQHDRPLASELLSAVPYFSLAQIREGLYRTIRDAFPDASPAVCLYPVRDLPPGRIYFRKRKSERPVLSHGNVGGEAIVGRLLREICHRSSAPALWERPSLRKIEKSRRESAPPDRAVPIVLVDDFAGTGATVGRCIDAVYRHKTIKSWVSAGWATLHAVLFAATEYAVNAIEQDARVTSVHWRVAVETSRSRWDFARRRAFTRLAREYGRRGGFVEHSLGYDDQYALVAFEHTVPNNAPGILWCERTRWGVSRWQPVVRRRTVSQVPPTKPARRTTVLVQGRRVRLQSLPNVPALGCAEDVAVFCAMASRVTNQWSLCEATCLPASEIVEAQQRLALAGLLVARPGAPNRWRLTDRGHAAWKSLRRHVAPHEGTSARAQEVDRAREEELYIPEASR